MSGQTPPRKNKIVAEKPPAAGRGRPKGALNKTTALAKEAISLAFENMGGTDALVKWAKASDDNRRVFYSQIWTKIIPLQVAGSGEDGEVVHRIILEGVMPK